MQKTQENSLANFVKGGIYNIPATKPFLKSLAIDFVENGSFKDLIILPTKRACTELQKEIYSLSKKNGLSTVMLPNIMVVGTMDEDDLYFEEATKLEIESIKSSSLVEISNIERTAILSQLIMNEFSSDNKEKSKGDFGWDKAISLSMELGKIIDLFEIEGVDLDELNNVYPKEKSLHYQNILKLLDVAKDYQKEILSSKEKVSQTIKKLLELNKFADFLSTCDKYKRVILAGNYGCQPSKLYLIERVLQNKNGILIIPAIDINISNETWKSIDPSHPQYEIKKILSHLSIDRENIEEFPVSKEHFQANQDLEKFLSEIMKSGEVKLRDDKKITKESLENLSFITAQSNREESELISISIVEYLRKSPEKNISVISPDKQLSRAIESHLKIFNISSDNVESIPLNKTDIGQYLLLTSSLISSNFEAYNLISFLENKYSKAIESFLNNFESNEETTPEAQKKTLIKNIIDLVFRGENISEGINGILRKLQSQKSLKIDIKNKKPKPHLRNISIDEIEKIIAFINLLKEKSEIFTGIFVENKRQSFSTVLNSHMKFIEGISDYKNIFSQGDGKVLQKSLIEIKSAMSGLNINVNIFEYEKILESFLSTKNIKTTQNNHRVSIMNPQEAKMLQADYLILAGLNEGIFPQAQKEDIILNEDMKKQLELPLAESKIGSSSFDFVTLISSSEKALITHSQKRDGATSLPSRWIQKIEACLSEQKIIIDKSEENRLRDLRNKLFSTKDFSPLKRTSFNPPIENRGVIKKLPATFIEKALKDPYQIYARYMLNLYKKYEINQAISPADLGTTMHEALENFVKKDMNHRSDLTQEFKRLLELRSVDDGVKIFWQGRFERFAKWFARKYKEDKNEIIKHSFTEIKGSYQIPISESQSISNGESPLVIEGTADRIDQLNDKTFQIIDYKTGTFPSWTKVMEGSKPQMAIEALILEKGIFKSSEEAKELKTLMGGKVSKLAFITMQPNKTSVGDEQIFPTEKMSEEDGKEILKAIIEKTESGLQTLNKEFLRKNRELIACPTPESQEESFFNDYKHLERLKEWKNNV